MVEPIYKLYDRPANLRHAVFDSPHDYSQAMREAMYGWMTLHLKGEGDGSPIVEREVKTLDPEELRCFPGDTRPADYLTLPRFAAREGREALHKKPAPDHLEFWESDALTMREGLERVLGRDREEGPLNLKVTDLAEGNRLLEFDSEPGVRIAATHLVGQSKQWVVLVDHAGRERAAAGEY